MDQDADIRTAALLAPGLLRDQAAVRPVLHCLEDRSSQVRAMAVQALGIFRFDESWLPGLERAAQDESVWVRLETAHLLERLNKRPARPALVQMLVDAHPDVHLAATRLARPIEDFDLLPALQQCDALKGRAAREARELIAILEYRRREADPVLWEQAAKARR